MNREPVAGRLHRLVYDGTNQADIAAELGGGYTLVSDNGSTLQFSYMDVPYSVSAGGSIMLANGGHVQYCLSAIDFADMQMRLPRLTVGTGSAVVPGAALGGTQQINVDITPAMPDTTYKPIAQLHGAPAALAGHGITAVSVVDANTVQVTVQSAVDSTSGVTVHVHAHGLVP